MEEILDDVSQLQQPTYNSFKSRVLFIWGGVLFIAFLFKVMHWPGQAVLMLLATGGLSAYAISGMLSHKGKDSLNLGIFVAAMLWTLFIFWGVFFNGGYPYNFRGLNLYIIIIAIYLAAYEIAKYVRKKNWEKKQKNAPKK